MYTKFNIQGGVSKKVKKGRHIDALIEQTSLSLTPGGMVTVANILPNKYYAHLRQSVGWPKMINKTIKQVVFPFIRYGFTNIEVYLVDGGNTIQKDKNTPQINDKEYMFVVVKAEKPPLEQSNDSL